MRILGDMEQKRRVQGRILEICGKEMRVNVKWENLSHQRNWRLWKVTRVTIREEAKGSENHGWSPCTRVSSGGVWGGAQCLWAEGYRAGEVVTGQAHCPALQSRREAGMEMAGIQKATSLRTWF